MLKAKRQPLLRHDKITRSSTAERGLFPIASPQDAFLGGANMEGLRAVLANFKYLPMNAASSLWLSDRCRELGSSRVGARQQCRCRKSTLLVGFPPTRNSPEY